MKKWFLLCLSVLLVSIPVIAYADSENAVLSDSPSLVVLQEDDAQSDLSSPDSSQAGGEPSSDSYVSEDAVSDPVLSGDAADLAGQYASDSGNVVVVQADQVILASDAQPFAPPGAPLAGGYYIDCLTSALGDVRIYVPCEYQYGSFTTNSNGDLVSLRSSTVTGILYSGDTSYTVRWRSFGTPQYRSEFGSSSSYSDLGVSKILDTNVQILSSDSDVPLLPSVEYLLLVLILLLGVCCVCKFMTL